MSNLSDQVLSVIQEAFPQIKIKKEEMVLYKGQKLYLDFWIPQLGLIIEVHGSQHDKFVEHFHKDGEGFRASKKRDRLKEEWADLNGHAFVAIREKELPITVERLLEKIDAATDNGQG
jgi:very-short-patch-repair endonuclease